MSLHKLSGGSISVLDKHTLEVVPNSDVEISVDMVEEFLGFIEQHMEGAVAMLLNKSTTYSYQFDALQKFSACNKIAYIAVVSYDDLSTKASAYLGRQFNKSGKNIKVFDARDKALAWLRQKAAVAYEK